MTSERRPATRPIVRGLTLWLRGAKKWALGAEKVNVRDLLSEKYARWSVGLLVPVRRDIRRFTGLPGG